MMKDTLKIHGRGIGKMKESIDLILKLIKENPEKNKIHVISNTRSQKAYVTALEQARIKVEIINKSENYVVMKCRR